MMMDALRMSRLLRITPMVLLVIVRLKAAMVVMTAKIRMRGLTEMGARLGAASNASYETVPPPSGGELSEPGGFVAKGRPWTLRDRGLRGKGAPWETRVMRQFPRRLAGNCPWRGAWWQKGKRAPLETRIKTQFPCRLAGNSTR